MATNGQAENLITIKLNSRNPVKSGNFDANLILSKFLVNYPPQ